MLPWLPAAIFAFLLLCGLIVLAVSRSGAPPPPTITQPSPLPSELSAPTRVDLNYATQAELEALPAVGATTAQAIIERRANAPIGSLRELLNAAILSERQLAAIAPLVTLTIREPPP